MIEPTAGVQFRILGPLEVWSGEEWSGIRAAKWRALLAILLLHAGQLVSTDRLITELWGDSPPATAGNLVSVYVLRLRRMLGELPGFELATRPTGYQLGFASDSLDVERFTALVAEGRAELAAGSAAQAAAVLASALGLWRGRALADVPASPLITAEASRLEESRVQALALRIEADLRCGRYGQVVPELQRLLADHPLREELWVRLMRALHGDGRPAAALEAYGRAREVIAEELGVDPGPELQQLYVAILAADATAAADASGPRDGQPSQPATGDSEPERPGPGADAATAGLDQAAAPAPVPVPAQLPADIADFTGRADQVDELCALLRHAGGEENPEAVPVVLVMGSGGLGKTTLAVHAAHKLAGDFPDGQLFASLLGATQPAEPADVLARFLRDLGVAPAHMPVGEEERAAQFRTRLAGRRVLVVLDDARDAAQVRPLLPGSASCAVLITARGRLPELVGSRIMDLDVLPADEARALFARVAGQGRAAAEPAATGQVLAACAGLPLAIRIAGARLAARGGWNVHYLAGRLSDERRRLDELRAGNLAVRASFEVSFASLAGSAEPDGLDPARAFRLLGVWTGPSIPLPAAAALFGEADAAAADAIAALVDAHLLDEPGPDQYRFHDLLRVYAADRARAQESDATRRDAITRVLAWYLHTAEAAAQVISPQHARVPLGQVPPGVRPLRFESLDEALDWCEAQRAGLLAGTRLAAESGLHEIAWQLPAAAMSFFYRRSHWVDWVSTHETGLASARTGGDRRAQAWLLNNLGIVHSATLMPESVTCSEQALTLYRELGDSQGETRASNNVANALFKLGRFEEAQVAAQRSLDIQRRNGNRYGEGLALNVLGSACRELDLGGMATDSLQQALVIFRELGDPQAEADTLSELGEAYIRLDQMDDALATLRESLAIWRDIGNRHDEAATLQRLGQALSRVGDSGQARDVLGQAATLFEALGDQVQANLVRALLAPHVRQAG